MILLQASSCQNDLAGAFWVSTLAALVFASSAPIWVGLATGLAIATKGTAYIYGFPLLIFFFYRNRRGIPAVLGLAVLLNLGHWRRNFTQWGWFLGNPLECAASPPKLGAVSADRQWAQKSRASLLFAASALE